MLRTSLALLAGVLLSSAASAQTTHTVNLNSTSFSPAAISVQPGDTVDWVWVTGFHDVQSGLGGAANGIFVSGSPQSGPNTYSVTFDAAFLAANPVAGDVYNYFCSIHVGLGMTGSVTVECPASASIYGSGINPAGSIAITGTPQLGGSFSMSVDNPTGSQPIGSLVFLAIANAADPNFPAGTPLPGFGMSGMFGELLIDVAPPNPIQVLFVGSYTGSPASISISIPNDPGLACRQFFAQGVVFDPSGTGPRFGLSQGAALTLGS